MGFGIETPEVAHELLERLVSRFEYGEVSGALEQPQASTEVQGVLCGVECSLGALAPRVLEPDSVDVIDLATAAATLANLNSTDWLRAHVYVYRRPEPRVCLRRPTTQRPRPAQPTSKRLTPPKRPRDILRRLSPKGQPVPESALVLEIFLGVQVVTGTCGPLPYHCTCSGLLSYVGVIHAILPPSSGLRESTPRNASSPARSCNLCPRLSSFVRRTRATNHQPRSQIWRSADVAQMARALAS